MRLAVSCFESLLFCFSHRPREGSECSAISLPSEARRYVHQPYQRGCKCETIPQAATKDHRVRVPSTGYVAAPTIC